MKYPDSILQRYLFDCVRFGWPLSWRGLAAYIDQERRGLREVWRNATK